MSGLVPDLSAATTAAYRRFQRESMRAALYLSNPGVRDAAARERALDARGAMYEQRDLYRAHNAERGVQ